MKQFTTYFTFFMALFLSNLLVAQSEDCSSQPHFMDVIESLICNDDPGCNEEAIKVQNMVMGFDLNCQKCIDCQMPTFETIEDITTGVDNLNSNHGFFNNTVDKGEIETSSGEINTELGADFNLSTDVVLGLINHADQSIDLETFFECLNIDCLIPSIIDTLISLDPTPLELDAIEYMGNHSMDSLVRAFFGITSPKPPCYSILPNTIGSGESSEESEHDFFVEQSNIFEGLNISNPTNASFFNSSTISSGVNEYNGMAQSSVSIYDYVNRDINVPISISHQGSGIKVNEFSGSVGQNWDLSAIASITRKLNGLPDEFNGTQNGVGFTTIQKLGMCMTLGGVGIANTAARPLEYNPFRPNELNINISIPLGPLPIYLIFTFQIKFDLVAMPGRVNLEERGVGYLHLQDETIMSEFDVPNNSVTLENLIGDNPSWDNDDISDFLEKASDDKERNDRRFLNPYLDRFIGLFQGFLNLFSEETIETQKIDTEPDEFYINLPGYSGKFMFTQEGEIITFPHADFIIDKEVFQSEGGYNIRSFTVHMTDGISYFFGNSAIDQERTDTYVLPNIFTYYPVGGPTNTIFGPADLDESDTPMYNPYLCLPQYRKNKKSYENDNVLMSGVTYISKWHCYKIESRLTGAQVSLSYDSSGELTYYTNQSFYAQFPNFALVGGGAFGTAQESLLRNPGNLAKPNGNQYIYLDGQSKLDYIVNQKFIQKSRLAGISGTGNPDNIKFYYETPHPEIYNDKLLSRIVLYKSKNDTLQQFKKWRFNYLDGQCGEVGDIVCNGSDVSKVNFDVPEEWEFQLNDQLSKSLFRYYLKHLGIRMGPVTATLEFDLPFISYYGPTRDYITVLKERGSVLQIKAYFDRAEQFLESQIWKAEFKRAFLESIDEISFDDEEIENLVQIEYFGDICELPKKHSRGQDQWGYYNGVINNSPIPNIGYTDYNGNYLSQFNHPFVGRHIGLLDGSSPFGLQDNSANLNYCEVGAVKSVTYKTGLKHEFTYELNNLSDIPAPNLGEAGLRVSKFVVHPGIGPSKVSEFQYKDATQITSPKFISENSVNQTFFGNENYIQVQSNGFVELQNNKSNLIGYGTVIENIEGNGKIINKYSTSDGAVFRYNASGLTRKMHSILSTDVYPITYLVGDEPFAPAVILDWRIGNPIETHMFDLSGNLKYQKFYKYDISAANYCRTDEAVGETRPFSPNNVDNSFSNFTQTDRSSSYNHVLEDDDPEDCGFIGSPSISSIKKSYFHNFIPPPFTDFQSMRTMVANLPFKSDKVYQYFINFIIQQLENINNLLVRQVLKHQIYTGLKYNSEQFYYNGDSTIVFYDDDQYNISETKFGFKQLGTFIHAEHFDVETKQRPIYHHPEYKFTTYNDEIEVKSKYFYPFGISSGQHDLVKFSDNSKLENVFKNSCINNPIRVEEYLNGTLVGGNLSKYVFFKESPEIGHLRKAVNYAFAGETFVPVSAHDDWDGRGNPKYVQQTNILTENFDANQKGIIELKWHEDFDLLLEKKYLGSENFIETYEYNDFSQLVSQTSIDGIVNTYEYDGFGRVKKAILQNGLQEDNFQYTFNPTTKRILTNFPGGGGTQRTKIEYNGLGQTLKTGRTTILAATFEENEYDNMFRLKTQSVMGRGTVENTYQFSPVERLAETVDSEGNLTKYRYLGGSGYSQIDGAKQAIEVIDPNGHKYVDIMDGLSRKVGSISGEGGVTKFQYDTQGRIKKIINPITEEYLYTYNNLGLLSQKKVPNAAPEEYYYDEYRMPLMTHDGNGNYFSKERDEYFREVNTYWTDAGLSPAVDGTLNYVTNPQALYNASEVVNAITYISGNNRIDEITETLFGPVDNTLEKISSFTYDNFGRVEEENITYPEGIVVNNTNTYTAGTILRDLDKEINGTTYTISNSFDIINRPVDFTFSTGTFNRKLTTVKYDSEDRVSSKDLFGISAPLQTVDYGYDAIGRLITINSPFTTECEVPDQYDKEICFFEIQYQTQNYQTIDGSPQTFPCYEIDRIEIDGVEYNLPNSINMTSPDFDAQLESFIHSLNFEGNVVLEIDYVPTAGPGGSVVLNPNGTKKYILKIFDTDFESITLLSVLYPGSIHCSHTLTRLNCCPAEDPIDPDPDPEDPDPNPEEEGNDLFFETLVYNGLDIRQIDMGNGCNLGIIRNQYRYDADHRLNSVKNFMIFESETQENNYNSLYEYDAAGNITSLKRRGFLEKDPVTEVITYDDIDDLTYTYGANSSQLDLVKEGILLDRGVKFGNYNLGYDGKGNALSMMGSALSYNPINLPKVISTSTGEERIWYTINGEKFKIMTDTEVTEDEVTTTETKTRYLVQGFELADGGAVHSFNFGDGRVLMPGGEDTLAVPRVQFHIKDHLGNVMVVFEDKDDDNEIDIEDTEEPNEIIERFMYYAFGMQWEGAWMYDEPIDSQENRYRYNGKEYSKGSRLSDYGARYYSSDIGRWNAVDPLADHPSQVDKSPYAYAWNIPVNLTDPDGRCPICPFIAKGLAGAAVDYMLQGAFNYASGMNMVDAFSSSNIDMGDVVLSGAQGALPWSVPGGKYGKAAAAAVSDVMFNYAKAFANGEAYAMEQMAQDFLIGFVAQLGSEQAGEFFGKYKSQLNRRANYLKWSPNWSSGSFSKTLNKYTPNAKGVKSADGVKTRYINDKYEVIFDNENNYFRVKDINRNQYLDVDGKVPSKNVNQNTHIKNNDGRT